MSEEKYSVSKAKETKIANVIKRDGTMVPFDSDKIYNAIRKAGESTGEFGEQESYLLTAQVLKVLEHKFTETLPTIECIQDVVEQVLISANYFTTAKAYILYRADRTRVREMNTSLMKIYEDLTFKAARDCDIKRENANIDGDTAMGTMLKYGSEGAKQFNEMYVLAPEHSKAHRDGDIHIHDLDFYGKTLNCLNIPLGRLLAKGFNNGHGFIRPPRRPGSATALAAIILQSSQNDMFGGQSFGYFDTDIAPFMEGASEEEVFQAMEALVYNLNSMHSRAGAQVPFSSLNLGLDTSENGRKVTRNLLNAYAKGLGRGENPIFPNVIFRVKRGINLDKGDSNYDLFQLAISVAAKRLNPTFSFMDTSFNKP